jgi:hypothetical protein
MPLKRSIIARRRWLVTGASEIPPACFCCTGCAKVQRKDPVSAVLRPRKPCGHCDGDTGPLRARDRPILHERKNPPRPDGVKFGRRRHNKPSAARLTMPRFGDTNGTTSRIPPIANQALRSTLMVQYAYEKHHPIHGDQGARRLHR